MVLVTSIQYTVNKEGNDFYEEYGRICHFIFYLIVLLIDEKVIWNCDKIQYIVYMTINKWAIKSYEKDIENRTDSYFIDIINYFFVSFYSV